MVTITAIKPQKSNKRVNIYLDGKFGFGLDLENYVESGLKVGQELSEEKVSDITKKGELQKLIDRILFFSTLRPRSEKEVNDWMSRKKVSIAHKNILLGKLRKLELLDDEKFALWWVEQRMLFKSRSGKELIQELKSKGIAKDVIDEVLYKSGVDDEKAARKLIEKNIYKWLRYPKNIANQKTREYLLRKGFNWIIIKKVTG